jgi:hypothetical protein
MLPEDRIFNSLDNDERWKRYCGFLDLSVEEFLEIQNELMADQLGRIPASVLGRHILGDKPPATVAEMRARVPLTTHDDYEPWLSRRDESALAAKACAWCHSSGRGGRFKWIPHSTELMDKTARNLFGAFILSSATERGDIRVAPGVRFLTTLPAAPYSSGVVLDHFRKRLTVRPMPDPDAVAALPFQQQVARGFEDALRGGFDVCGAMAVILVRIGQQMAGEAERSRTVSWSMFHPAAIARMLRAWRRSRLAGRPIYPRDLWTPKGIMAGGLDIAIYRQDIERYWGVRPFDVYASSETMFLALQGWNKKALTPLADSVFMEFLPHDPSASDGSPDRPTLLLDELEEGKLYELIVSHFHGMPLLRYRIGDVIRVVSMGDTETGARLPQLEVQRKVGETINLSGLCALDERMLSGALSAAGIPFSEWTALKEYDHNTTFLRMIVELREKRSAREVSALLDARLKDLDTDYSDVERYGGSNPVRTTVLAPGSFARYSEAMLREGRELAYLKPRHVNPQAEAVERLLRDAGIVERE